MSHRRELYKEYTRKILHFSYFNGVNHRDRDHYVLCLHDYHYAHGFRSNLSVLILLHLLHEIPLGDGKAAVGQPRRAAEHDHAKHERAHN